MKNIVIIGCGQRIRFATAQLPLHVKEFENSPIFKPNCSVEDFSMWLNDEKYREESPAKLFKNENHQVSFTENEICKQVLLLSRYSKLLIRKGLGFFPELANEEFTYLYCLKDEPFLTKIQLIEKNGHEKKTGTQIIKRLLEAGFLEEKNDETDKRSKRLNLIKLGEKTFHESVKMWIKPREYFQESWMKMKKKSC